jgi:hypothetical protein
MTIHDEETARVSAQNRDGWCEACRRQPADNFAKDVRRQKHHLNTATREFHACQVFVSSRAFTEGRSQLLLSIFILELILAGLKLVSQSDSYGISR